MAELDFQQVLIAGIAAAIGLVIVAAKFKAALLTLMALLGAAALGPITDDVGRAQITWLSPLQFRRRELFAIAGAMLIVTMVFYIRRIRVERVAGTAICLLAIGLYAGLIRIVAALDTQTGLISILYAVATIGPAMFVIPALIDDEEDHMWMLRAIAGLSLLWAGGVAVQFLISRGVLTARGGRFNGLLGNPQHAASYLAVAATVCLFLLINDKHRFKAVSAAALALNFAMLLWTGSRTGLAMSVIGFTAVLYTRVGRAILYLPVAAVLFLVAVTALEANIGVVGERLREGGDTRTQAWRVMLEVFLENPVFGVGEAEKTGTSENSYLYGLAAYGIGMGALILVLVLVAAFQGLKLVRVRGLLSPLEKRLADLCLGYYAMYFGSAMFEGIILGRNSVNLVFILIFGAMAVRLADQGAQIAASNLAGSAPRLDDTGWGAAPEDSRTLALSPDDTASRLGLTEDELAEFADYGSETDSRRSRR